MKITFVETPAPWLVRQHTQAPLGMLYLATILRRAGHDVRLLRPLEIADLEACADDDVVAFGGTTLEFPVVVGCLHWMREHCPRPRLWYGGVHATAIPGDWLLGEVFEFIGYGEAEGYIERAATMLSVPFSAFPARPMDLDTIPFPDRTLLEGRRGGSIMSFHEDEGPSANMITSRGCQYNCAFCGARAMWGEGVRWRSAENVIEEVRQIVDGGCRTIRFEDDNFAVNRNRLQRMAPAFEEMGIAWHGSARAQNLTVETCQLLVQSGCQELSVGIESGDQRVLDCLNKRAQVEQLVRGVRTATDAGIHVRALWMTGTPGEREDTPERNRGLLERLPVHSHALATFIPLPGTPIWEAPQRFNVEITDRNFCHYNQWLWERDGEEVRLAEYHPLIRNLLLSPKQQQDNVYRMRKYVLDTRKVHPG